MKIPVFPLLVFMALIAPTRVAADGAGNFPRNGEEILPIANRMAFSGILKNEPAMTTEQTYNFVWTAGFIQGVVEAVNAQAHADKMDTSCMDITKVSGKTMAMSVLTLIDKNPKLKSEPPIAAVWTAVVAQYPCISHPAHAGN